MIDAVGSLILPSLFSFRGRIAERMKVLQFWSKLRGHSEFGTAAALTSATNLVLGVLAVCTGAIAARLLGPHGRGELAAIQTWPSLMGYLTMLGTEQALVYYISRDPERGGRYLGCAVVIALVTCVPLMACAYLEMPWLLSAQSRATVAAARWYLLVAPVIALLSLPVFALRGGSDFLPWNAMRLLAPASWLAILVFAMIGQRTDPRFVAQGYLIALAVLAVPAYAVARRHFRGSFLPDRQLFKPMLVYGFPCLASTFPIILNLRLDQMLMAGLLPPGMLGLYVAAVAWAAAINPLMNAVGSVLFPKVASEVEQTARLRSFSRGCRLAALLALTTAPILMALTPWGLSLIFGRKFQAAIPAGLILVPAGAIAAMNSVIEEGMRGLGNPMAVLHAELAGLVVTGVSLYLLLRPMGIVGASLASMLGYSTVMATLMLRAWWLTGESPVSLLVPSRSEVYIGAKWLAMLVRQ
jgi:O-antigen/teichoic acid export membrane protein